jgi:hypothetical protein
MRIRKFVNDRFAQLKTVILIVITHEEMYARY